MTKVFKVEHLYGKEDYHPKHNPMGGHFDLDDSFYTQTDLDEFWGVNIQQLSDLALKYGVTFSENEIKEFIKYLYEKPMLAFKSKIAEKLYSLLTKSFETRDYEIRQHGQQEI